ncbi:MAG: acyl-CoA dehydrogenase family protein [Acetobacteraceae bacterium]|nr:acyl-CoA dehydrogenase family protein [Acetobacteraceae bacterium]
MDFSDTPQEAAFRAEARAFLDANAEPLTGTNAITRGRVADDVLLQRAAEWQAKKADAGFAVITWAKEHGGRAGSPIQHVIYGQEEARYAVPRGVYEIGLGMCVPTVIAHGTPGQVARHVRPAVRGEEIWCQLFSEPAAGSDVAGLRTRAVKDGEDWVINGQKIWTSGAHYADWGLLLARTDPNAAKHAGLTMFVIPMKGPGVEVRRIKQIAGTSNFNEVFFTDLRVPDTARVGAVGQGWKVGLTTLMNERMTIGGSVGVDFDEIFALARDLDTGEGPAIRNAAVRERLAEWYVRSRGLKHTHMRTVTKLSRGERPGPENSIGKLVTASKLQEIASFALDLQGAAGVVMDRELAPMRALFQESLLSAPGHRIAGGTDEIMKNIIAERVLGLPGDVRVDRDVPFSAIPTGKR